MREFDAIIGAGLAVPSLAGRLTGAGMTVTFVERKLFGGTCIDTGCTPTKTLIASTYAAHLARRRLRRPPRRPGAHRHAEDQGARRRRGRELAQRSREVAAWHGRLHRRRRARALRRGKTGFA